MKKHLIYLLAAAVLALAGCSDKADDETVGIDGFGALEIDCASDSGIDTRALTPPAGTRFALILTNEEGYAGKWSSISTFSRQDTIFKQGPYKAVVTHGKPDAEGLNKPYYYGEQEFTIQARRTAQVSITARIANSQTVVRATEQFLNYFHDATFTVTTASGAAFTFTPGAATPAEPVFVKAETSLTVTGTARRQSQTGTGEGQKVTFKEQTLASTKPATCHIFKFDAAEAGGATLTIYLGDEYTETITLDLEMNDGAIDDNE